MNVGIEMKSREVSFVREYSLFSLNFGALSFFNDFRCSCWFCIKVIKFLKVGVVLF